MDLNEYCVRSRYNEWTEFIFVKELNLDTYLHACRQVFKIESEIINIELSDNTGAIIPKNKFENIVKRYHCSASFVVVLNILEENLNFPIVSQQMLENFLRQENEIAFTKRIKQKTPLTKPERNKLMRHVGEFTRRRYGFKPSKSQKVAVARALIELAPSLKSAEPDRPNFDIVFNAVDGGLLGTQMRNKRAAQRKNVMNEAEHMENILDQSILEIEASNEVEDMKTMVVNQFDLDVIKEKLDKTLRFRSTMLDEMRLNLRESFPYFFTAPALILYEYPKRSSKIDGVSVNADGFLSKWPNVSKEVHTVLSTYHVTSFETQWCQEIEQILALIKLLPAVATGRNMLSMEAFAKVAEKLFVFRQTHTALNKIVEAKNKHPYIIAFGDSPKEINHFLIEIEREYINVPLDFSAAQTFDLYFKVHKVFGLHFNPALKRAMDFVEYFMYENKRNGFRQTTGVKTLYNQLFP